jgi:hypothetical protein
MGIHPLVSLDMVLRWTEITVVILSIGVIAGVLLFTGSVLLFFASVLHATRGDTPSRRPISPREIRGHRAPSLPRI